MEEGKGEKKGNRYSMKLKKKVENLLTSWARRGVKGEGKRLPAGGKD